MIIAMLVLFIGWMHHNYLPLFQNCTQKDCPYYRCTIILHFLKMLKVPCIMHSTRLLHLWTFTIQPNWIITFISYRIHRLIKMDLVCSLKTYWAVRVMYRSSSFLAQWGVTWYNDKWANIIVDSWVAEINASKICLYLIFCIFGVCYFCVIYLIYYYFINMLCISWWRFILHHCLTFPLYHQKYPFYMQCKRTNGFGIGNHNLSDIIYTYLLFGVCCGLARLMWCDESTISHSILEL